MAILTTENQPTFLTFSSTDFDWLIVQTFA